MKIDTDEKFNVRKNEHLNNLKEIREFILGNKFNQPQVTYVPEMLKFHNLYEQMEEWIKTSYFDGDND